MSLTLPLYEGDSIIHRPPRRKLAVSRSRTAVRTVRHPARPGGLLRLYRAFGHAIAKAGDWLEDFASSARRREIEAYLSVATDHADLERRMRDLERRDSLPFPYI